MTHTRRRVASSFLGSVLLAGGLLPVLVLHPRFLYAHRTATPDYVLYHNQPVDPAWWPRLAQARALVQPSPWFASAVRLNVCLNDGSPYPALVERLWGPAFAWGFSRNVVLNGEAHPKDNYVRLNGYNWNLVQLLAHESVHCYQAHRLGFWRANPVARYPAWKWEGYAEYVARQRSAGSSAGQQLRQLQHAEHATPQAWALSLADSTSVSREYARYRLLTTYCLDVKNMSYPQLLADTASERTVQAQLTTWQVREKNRALNK